MSEDTYSLGISGTDFNRYLLTREDNNVGGPDFDVDSIYLTRNDRLNIRGKVVTIRAVCSMTRMVLVYLAKTDSLPPFADRNWVANSASIELLVSSGIPMTNGEKYVNIFRHRPTGVWCDGYVDMGEDVAGDLCLLGECCRCEALVDLVVQ